MKSKNSLDYYFRTQEVEFFISCFQNLDKGACVTDNIYIFKLAHIYNKKLTILHS